MIESRQLRCFVAVAEDLHFARAADRLHLAQSALSAQIHRLEQDLGVRLLDRNKRAAVKLTPAGALFLAEAKSALSQLERAEQIGRLAARGETGKVVLGYVGSAVTSGLLTELLSLFRPAHAQVHILIVAMETPRQLAAIADGLIDVGIIRPRPRYDDGVAVRIAQRERLAVAMPLGHPLAQRAFLKPADLRDEAFIAPEFNETAGFAAVLQRLGQCGGFEGQPAYRVNDFVSAASMAAAGYGVVLAPRSLQAVAPPGLVFRPIEDFDDEVELAVAYRSRELSPSVRAFLKAVDDYIGGARAVRSNPQT